MWESLGCPGESQLDCGTYRTLGQLPRVGVLGTPGGTVGQTARTLGQLQRCGSPWDVVGGPSWTVGLTGH